MSRTLPKYFTFSLPFLLVIGGLLLRAYHWGYYPFNFDQVQILTHAEGIRQGDFTLIGPRTGPAPMFTGPLIYYVTAALMFLVPSPYTVVATALVLSAVTGSVLWWLTQKYLGRDKAMIITALWAFSPFLIALDRIPWNPNLTILAASLAFFPLFQLLQSEKVQLKKHWFDMGLIGLGCFLGYQAHFGALLLSGLVTVSFLLRKRFPIFAFAAAWGGLVMSLLPTVLFDYRHDWMNARGLLGLLTGNSGALLIDRLKYVVITAVVAIGNIGRLFFLDTNSTLILLSGVAVVGWSLWRVLSARKTKQTVNWLPLEWFLISTVILSFYKENKPEYYFLFQMPAVLMMLAELIQSVLTTEVIKRTALGGFILYSAILVLTTYRTANGITINSTVEAVKYFQKVNKEQGVSKIVYDMDPVYQIGFEYLLRGFTPTEKGKVVHFQYSYQKGSLTSHAIEDLGVWVDPRTTAEYHYVTEPTYIIGSPMNIEIHRITYPQTDFSGSDHYKVWLNDKPVGTLVVISKTRHPNAYQQYTPELEKQFGGEKSWTHIHFGENMYHAYMANAHYFIFIPDLKSDDQTHAVVDHLEIVN